ncbi:hypothetical protein [Bacteroides congonensis]
MNEAPKNQEETEAKNKGNWKSPKMIKFHNTLFIVLFLLVGTALVFAVADIDCSSLIFSMDKLSTLIGVYVSVIGIFITSYFVVLAIDAYSHIKEIQKSKTKIEELIESWTKSADETKRITEANVVVTEQRTKEAAQIIKSYSEILYDDLGEQIALEGGNFTGEEAKIARRNALKLRQSRLSYTFPMLDLMTRIKLLLELASIGEEKDIPIIKEHIIENEKEPKELKEVAKLVIQELEKRLKTK